MGILILIGGVFIIIGAICIVQMVFKLAALQMNKSTAKTIVFWVLILATAVLYQVVQRTSSVAAVRSQVSAPNHTEYLVAPVGPSVEDVRVALESRANAGWEFTAPVTNNGTTTALIFKRQRK
jgi:membrane-bound ClpP family serine protease